MAVTRLFFRTQFRKSFSNRRKIKQRIVAEAVRPSQCVEDNSFGSSAKCSQSLTVARCRQHANKSARALSGWNPLQVAQNASVVGFVIGIRVSLVRLFIVQIRSRVSRRVYSGCSMQSVNLKAGVVGDHDLSGSVATISFGLFSRIRLEGQAVFDHGRQGSEVWDSGNLNSMLQSRSRKIAQLARIRGRNKDLSHHAFEPFVICSVN